MVNKRLFLWLISILHLLTAHGQNWWENHFVIGMMFDPPITSTGTPKANFQKAIDAGFNLFTGDFQEHDHCNRPEKYSLVRDSLRNENTFFFAPRWSSMALTDYDGRYVFDEPDAANFQEIRDIVNNYTTQIGKLCYVNLFPYYKFNNWTTYESYLNIFCDSIQLPVLSFDNYFPHSCFTPYDINCNSKLYYSNLAEMRKRAGNRPLWSWILSTEWITDRDTVFQKAYLRLSSFAPIAYGAKGLMYYSYDCKDKLKVARALNYRSTNAWDSSIFYILPDTYIDAHHVAFGYFTNPKHNHPDIGVKTDENMGRWYLKYTTDSSINNKNWDYTNHWYGTDSETIPFIVYDPSYDRIAAVSVYEELLVATGNTIWTFKPKLPEFDNHLFNQLDTQHVAAGSTSQGGDIVLFISWENMVRLYHDYLCVNDTCKYNQLKDFNLGQTVFQLINSPNGLHSNFHAICSGNGNSGWKLYSYNPQDSLWSSRTLTGSNLQHADHFWMEEYADSTILCMQLKPANGGYIYSGRIDTSSSNINMTDLWLPHSSRNYRAVGIRNSDGGYDLYCSMVPETHKDAIISRSQQETIRYQYISDINQYIRQHLQDIVLNCTWKGCYHATALPDANDCHIAMVDSLSTPVIKSMDSNLLAAIFEEADSILYVVLVNKSNATLSSASVTLRGNQYSVVEMTPRIDTGSTYYSSSFNPATMGRIVTWPQMTGGECVVLKLRKARNYFNSHRNSFFNSDNLADINHRFNNGTWRIDYANDGFGVFNNSYSQYGNDSNTYPILEDYNGDGITCI